MKVAIIGANGFIGSRLVEQFVLGGMHEVVPVVRKPSSLALPARFAVEWRLGDALNLVSLTEALRGCDAVVHSAIGDPRQIEQMPAILCEAAHAAGIRRIVYLSSASVHGQNVPEGCTEETPLHEKHSIEYNNAKVRAENSFFREAARLGLEGFALRPGVVYGPRSRWIADLATELRNGQAWLFDEGKGICNGIYVDNLIAAVELALTSVSGAGQAYLVGDEETTSWADFYFCVADTLKIPRESIHRLQNLPGFGKSFRHRVEDAMTQPWAQSMLPAIPGNMKRLTKTLLASWHPPVPPNAWELPPSPAPVITEEMASLQQCRWKFSHAKAAEVLKYAPPVSFPEAMRRTLAWLDFATHLS